MTDRHCGDLDDCAWCGWFTSRILKPQRAWAKAAPAKGPVIDTKSATGISQDGGTCRSTCDHAPGGAKGDE
jgi:hypothetical protein